MASVSVLPPISEGATSNYGSITGLTITRSTVVLTASSAPALISSQTTQTVTLAAGTFYDFTAQQVWVTPGANTDLAHGGYQMGSNRADSGITVGASVSATGLASASNRDAGTFYNGVSQGGSFTGQQLLAVSDLARGGGRHSTGAVVRIYITVQGIPSADTELTFYPNASTAPSRNTGRSTFSSQSITNDTSSTTPVAIYSFTNNTGNSVTIEGTEIENGSSAGIALDGSQFNITYVEESQEESQPEVDTTINVAAVIDELEPTTTNPNYATLLPQIARETDAVKKQALVDECYQFNEPLTLEEKSLFSYFTPDGIEDNDYVIDNPGLIQGNLFVSYVGDYYNRYAQTTTTEDDNTFGGPFYIYGTGKTGFGSGQLGFFYPLYTDLNEISGEYHVHTFEEYEGYTFYMPDSEMNHAVATAPSDLYEYGDFDVIVQGAEAPAPIIVVEYTPPPQEEAPAEEEEEEEVVTTTQTVAIAAPSTDDTYNNFGGITGLTLVRATSTSDSGMILRRNLTGSGGPVSFYVSPGNGSTRITDLELRTTGNARVCVSTSQQTSCSPTLGTKTLNNYTQVGSYNYSSNDGTVKEYARVRTTTTTYSATNNTGYPVTIEGIVIPNGIGPESITISGDVDVTYTSES